MSNRMGEDMGQRYIKTKTSGVRYREHPTRKFGIQKDKYYSIRYKLNGKDKEECLGWASQGWSEKKAAEYLFELKKNQRTGEGAKTLADSGDYVSKTAFCSGYSRSLYYGLGALPVCICASAQKSARLFKRKKTGIIKRKDPDMILRPEMNC